MVKRLSTMWETQDRSPGWEDSLAKEMAIHSSTIAWKIPWTAGPGRLQSMGSQRVGHDGATSLHFSALSKSVTQEKKENDPICRNRNADVENGPMARGGGRGGEGEDGMSPPGSPVPGIVQARTLEWVAISFSNA